MMDLLERGLFGYRRTVLALFTALSLFMLWSAVGLRVDAGFKKLLPLEHEYMQTFVQHQDQFGGANRILVALVAHEGDIFTPPFFDLLKEVTDTVFFIPGVDRAQVTSLYTPNVRYTEVVEDGIAGGNVVPDDFAPTPEGLARVRDNVLKAGIVGRLVANDFSGAIVSAQLLEIDPTTGRRVDLAGVARALETEIRERYTPESRGFGFDVHIIGFAKVIGDIADGARRVVGFFAIAVLVTAVLVAVYAQSVRLAVIPVACSVVAVVWQLGLLPLLDYGIDPMSILVPFLVFAIGVSHGVQMVGSFRSELYAGEEAAAAARTTFRRLLVPGGIALVTDTIGFVTILLIDIEIIREMAITASLGVAVIILTNLFLLPVLLSYVKPAPGYAERLHRRAAAMEPVWRRVSRVALRGPSLVTLAAGLVLLALGLQKSTEIRIGDLHRGVPELRPDSRYNLDSAAISERFSIGVDLLSVITESRSEGCIDHAVMTAIDDFAWAMTNVEGVQSVVALPAIAKVINAGWNEGSLAWRVIPRNPQVLTQSVAYVQTSSGLLNNDCSVMPVMLFTADHKAETIDRVVDAVKDYRAGADEALVRFRLATGNVGVMAATNEVVRAAQFPILLWVFAAVIALCLVTFRSVAATLCILLPLALVSILTYALMAMLEIGLKVNTLPVAALGAGIGVDYGIYIYSRLRTELAAGRPLAEAYLQTLRITGFGVVFTGVTLAVGVATWMFSPLKLQADMGTLLTFMFLVNMLGAILLLPALACWLLPRRRVADR